jgi:hypothetical protein
MARRARQQDVKMFECVADISGGGSQSREQRIAHLG